MLFIAICKKWYYYWYNFLKEVKVVPTRIQILVTILQIVDQGWFCCKSGVRFEICWLLYEEIEFWFFFYMYYKENFLVGKSFKYLQIIIILLVNLYIRGGYVGKFMSEFKSRNWFRRKLNFEFLFIYIPFFTKYFLYKFYVQ